MLLILAQWLQDDFGFFRVFNYITFRAVMATVTALLIGLAAGPWVIRKLTALKMGQAVRTDGPQTHLVKSGTPTMGGIIFILAAVLGYFLAHLISGTAVTASALLVMGLVVSLGFIGFVDDWLKVSRQNSRGLPGRFKLLGQGIFAAIFGYLGLQFVDQDSLTPISQYLSGVRETSIYLGSAVVIIWIVLMVMSASNGVNLTDGLDGLAGGLLVQNYFLYAFIGIGKQLFCVVLRMGRRWNLFLLVDWFPL